MLDLAERAVQRELGVRTVRLVGAMSLDQRREALAAFREDRRVRVMLLSLRAGNVGLNLTAARRVFLLDPWWNPAVEEQAINRVHRIGQPEEVSVVRLVVQGTVEEKMLELQGRKRRNAERLLDDAAGADEEASRQLRMSDLALCFE
ncbi:hypothetical protein EMIHUDRAFT_414962 [Emiliania huxleyi CCMP1516]|uniref:Helicase C-terminal domain-containing protein n=2 Tax=Emiliania huxleyi TaxID=2903 RepID=A0A0D3I9W2_EMIH1|nr:hypothetical protein EMIHUDRAFT_460012 [Emiliania huxleyi CCMP1516]XP_005790435.1 hypothetical protein EMIHUDRAFT_414962 [Emiliania huxleyi CCMP1516]EOD08047.1 hypothetical protein EMIHUDRAFT_460012 [Emiliania huxleyi CCMP1516]EOD38006.1 hypothetical protein EMIHUDRAFT_414962 [Emiliania huxleyi CCMP1516]|mmetsp:Transcript_4113/g.13171  ORF Transcript_4113/g.13171 Transcript_4113/m.13171 type:complete len:147 (+) Transcript_4113:104-544(+)|eukprot:XP_005760476.1 hypothetical protein EMIHUDRAFT_460012 [Emiliania huxleyi CCMP1516]